MSNPPDILTLDADTADFITHHVAIVVASSSADNMPSIARAYGCYVSEDRRAVTVMVLADHSMTLQADLRQTGRIAVVVTNPSTHKTIQLKGLLESIIPIQAIDRVCMQSFMDTFSEDIKALGYDDAFARAFRPEATAAAVRIRFLPSAIFVATPGPKAGVLLKSSS